MTSKSEQLFTGGDYQTATRMRQKLRAIPIPDDLFGLSVLDVGCDHGAFCKLALDRQAYYVLGLDRGRGVRVKTFGAERKFVDLVALNNSRGWRNCEFRHTNLGQDWEWFGYFDVIFFFSIYHHVFKECGDHDKIWTWLRSHLVLKGLLLFEGPVSVSDPIARTRATPWGGKAVYNKELIWSAAERAGFSVEYVGLGLHMKHREVWRCRPV